MKSHLMHILAAVMMLIVACIAPAASAEGNDEYTVLLVQSETTDGSTTFVDSAVGNLTAHTFTVNGNVHHETDQKKFGSSSIYFDGTEDFLSIPDSNEWDFDDAGTTDWCVDFWVYMTSLSAYHGFFGQSAGLNTDNGFQYEPSNNRSYVYSYNYGGLLFYSDVWHLNANQWYHIALTKDWTGSTNIYRIFIDGNQHGSYTTETGILNQGAQFAIGAAGGTWGDLRYKLTGYLEEFRVSKGTARWTSNFTPPTAPYSAEPEPLVCTDSDSDGWGASGSNLTLCDYHTAYDCNDSSASVYPGAYDVPNDGIDQDCSGSSATASYNASIIFTDESYAGLYYYYGDDIGYQVTFTKDGTPTNADVVNIVVNLTDPQGTVIKSQSVGSMTYTGAGTWTGHFTTHDVASVFDHKVALGAYVYGAGGTLLASRGHSDENLVPGTAPSVQSSAYTVSTGATSNYTVKDLVVQNASGCSINWTGTALDLHSRAISFDSAVKLSHRFVKMDSATYNELNKTAVLTCVNVDCSDTRIYYSSGDVESSDEVLSEDNLCAAPQCTNVQCSGGTLTVTVSHFSGYAVGSNTNMTIYDEIEAGGVKIEDEAILFYANYTNKTSGEHIPSAVCNISFDDGSGPFTMNDNGNNYDYNKTGGFASAGTHNWNVTCHKSGFNTLNATDDVFITSATAAVPEFSVFGIMLAVMSVLACFAFLRNMR